MTIRRIDVGPRMSDIVIHNNTVYLAGQVGDGATVAEQTRDILAQVEALADRISIVRRGRVVESGSLSDLRHMTRTTFVAETTASSEAATMLVLMPAPKSRPPGCSTSM